MSSEMMDPIAYEVVRNRLLAITEEMRIALQSVSGSPTVTEATDFFTGLYLPDGSFATMGHQVTHEASPVGAFIRHLQQRTTVDIGEGDMFIGNDPYVGALHQNDVQMAAPIFRDGRVAAWAGVMAHETDVGGMDFASWSPGAREVYQEGLRIPAVKLVDAGKLREDVLELIVTASRLPAALGLDIRAFIATLNVANSRLQELMDRQTSEFVEATMRRMIDETEEQTRERLRLLPDGTVHVRDFLEHDGHSDELYRVDLVLTKTGDQLVFDFGDSSPQSPGFINATRAGMRGGVTGGLIPTLGFGIPWNEGLLRPVEIIAPDGLICTATHPAPVGSATVETVWVVTNVVCRALSLLLSASERFADRAQGVSSGTMATLNMGGINQFGERFGLHLLDPLAGGSGAYASRDGIDAGGPPAVPIPSIADVETNEQKSPLLYLYRRLRPDTGGAGTRRGGASAEIALTVHGVEEADALIMTHGAEVPNSMGLHGGLPGSVVSQWFGSRALESGYPERLPGSLTEMGGRWEELGPKPGHRTITGNDVFAVAWQGGGGVGDPILRDPESVLVDVRRGVVSERQAEELYGVVITDDGVDLEGSERKRLAIREQRLGEAPKTVDTVKDPSGRQFGPGLFLHHGNSGWEVRSRVGAVLGVGSTDWRAGALRRFLDLGIPLHPDLTATAFYCPASGDLLTVDVHERGAEPFDDLALA